MNLSDQTKKLQNFTKKNKNIDNFSEHEISPIYQNFIDCITDHNHLYYVENKPIISDQEYDKFFTYLKKIEEYFPHLISSNSPTQDLIWHIAKWFKHTDHKVKLISLENSYDENDIIERWDRIKRELTKQEESTENLSYLIEPKFDGIGLEIIYKNGVFQQAITRGDGQTWDDISNNTKMIPSIPLQLKNDELTKDNITELSLRAEILMPKTQRKKINQSRSKQNKNLFANTRNATAWSIKLLDSNEVKKRGLVCFVYDIIYTNSKATIPKTHEKIIKRLKKYGLPVFERHQKKDNIDEIIKLCTNKTHQILKEYDYDFDGLVIKVNEINIRQKLWSTAHHPRRAIAYKFPAEQVSTQINSVDFQVGRTGIITPVANLAPVQLSGVTIKRVSLHNFDFINNKDIQIKDYVRIQRSGEVIPYIVSVIKERRKTQSKINPPKKCPSCNKKITQIDMHYYCTNTKCPAQIKERIIHFVSKNCMDIEGIGDSIIELLVNQKIIQNFADLYQIPEPQIRMQVHSLPGFWEKKLFEITKQLEASKTKPLRRLFNALWIPGIGKKMAQELANSLAQKLQTPTGEKNIPTNETMKQWNNKTRLQKISKQIKDTKYLNSIYWIWEKIINGITSYFDTNKDLLQKLEKTGLNFNPSSNINSNNQKSSALQGQSFGITGSFPISRELIIQAFENQGATFDSSPKKSTTYILIGSKPGSKKSKAKKLGIQIHKWRETIIVQFPFLENISETKKTSEIRKEWPQMQSLF